MILANYALLSETIAGSSAFIFMYTCAAQCFSPLLEVTPSTLAWVNAHKLVSVSLAGGLEDEKMTVL